MSWDEEAREIERLRALAALQGGAEAVAKQHARGRLSVRERIDALVDKGSFREQGGLAGATSHDADGELSGFVPSNAVIGTARIDGRPVIVCGDDFTVRGGAYSPAGMKKAEYADRLAVSRRVPNVRLLEAGGASVSGISGVRGRSGYDFVAGATTNRALIEARACVPLVAAALGPVAGFAAARLCAAHFSLMTRNAQVLVGGPALVARATREDVTKEELGGPEIHGKSGVVDNVAEDEADAWRQIRRFLSYLPSNVWGAPPVAECSDPRERREASLIEIVPRDGRKPYKMRRLIEAVVDRESFFELTPGYGRSQITGLARVAGHPIGVLANDPYVYGGSMTADGAQKLRRFAELCDSFHLPVVSLMDEPGFMIGTQAEQQATIRHGLESIFAVQQMSVPWFTLIVRRSFGVAAGCHLGPGGLVVAWPSAQSGALPLEGGIELAYRKEIAAAADPDARRRELEAEYAEAQSILPRAVDFGVHDLIDPRDTRPRLCEWVEEIALAVAELRGPRSYTSRP